MKILVSGDFCITPPFMQNNLFSEDVKNLFQGSDLNIVNLESPILDNDDIHYEILKTGPCLSTNDGVVSHLKDINVDFVTTANNHILDYGESGLLSTMKILNERNIDYVGIGKNITEAQKYKIKIVNDIKIGIVNFCESEWSIAEESNAGANPLDLIDNLHQIKVAKKECDFVFVIIHGGHEYYNLPSPRMVKQYRFFAENGADAVIGHHTHCISGFEIHQDVPIFYSLGNMLFTLPNENESWYTGLVLQIDVEKGKKIKWEMHPIRQSKKGFQVNLLKDSQKENILKEFIEYSEIITNKKNLIQNWKSFIENKKNTINIFSPINLIPGSYIRGALNRLRLNDFLLSKEYLAQIVNHARCEAHRDILVAIINKRLKK